MIVFTIRHEDRDAGVQALIEFLGALRHERCFEKHMVRIVPRYDEMSSNDGYAFSLIVGEDDSIEMDYGLEYGHDEENEEEL